MNKKTKNNLPVVGLVLIVVAIVVNIYAGQIQHTSRDIESSRGDKQGDKQRSNLTSAWLIGLSQTLVLAGIGFILFGIFSRVQSERELPLEELLDEARKRVDELPDAEPKPEKKMIKVTCPACKEIGKIEESDAGTEVYCPYCNEPFRTKPKPPKGFKAEE